MKNKKTNHTPLDRLKHHVTGAIERGEKKAIEAVTASHTPGKWGVVYDNSGARHINSHADTTSPSICSFRDKNTDRDGQWSKEITQANAHLISAAPDMLETLEAIEKGAGALTVSEIIDIASVAIAKAKGEKS